MNELERNHQIDQSKYFVLSVANLNLVAVTSVLLHQRWFFSSIHPSIHPSSSSYINTVDNSTATGLMPTEWIPREQNSTPRQCIKWYNAVVPMKTKIPASQPALVPAELAVSMQIVNVVAVVPSGVCLIPCTQSRPCRYCDAVIKSFCQLSE